jgi:hypothetical protein
VRQGDRRLMKEAQPRFTLGKVEQKAKKRKEEG